MRAAERTAPLLRILSFVGYAMMSALLPVWDNALVVSAYLASRARIAPRCALLFFFMGRCGCCSALMRVSSTLAGSSFGSCGTSSLPDVVLKQDVIWYHHRHPVAQSA